MRAVAALCLLLAPLSGAAALFATPTTAVELAGKVIGVSDGDTITILVDRRPIKVRLAEIDTPEKGQPYGSAAKQALSDLAFGKVATVHGQTRDRYGRTVGRAGQGRGEDGLMACIRKRRGKWVLDYPDQQGRRRWETVEGNRKTAERALGEETG